MRLSDFDQAIFDSVTPSDLGPVFTEYKNNPEGAIKRLMAERTGDARAVVERGDIGTIDLIYGNSKGGLAHIAMKHPEIIGMLPSLLRNGKLVKKPGARKVFLISERDPADVVVVALDWYGAAKTWVVTSYVDERGVFTGSTKRIDTDALDSAWVEVLYAGQWTKENTGLAKAWVVTSYDDHKGEASGILASVDTKKLDSAKMDCRSTVPMLVEILGHDMNSVNIFDNAAPLSALERLKLVKRLLELRNEANGLGRGGAAAMRKLKIAKETREIRQKLGLGGNATAQEQQATDTVQRVAAGTPADAESEGPIELTGKEFGDFPDTHEGRGELRKVVEENFRNILGRTFYSRALNAEVELRDSKQTPAKFFFKNFNPKKLKSVAAIGHLIRNGVKFKPSGKPYDKSDTNTKLYHYLRAEFVLDGELLAARIVICCIPDDCMVS